MKLLFAGEPNQIAALLNDTRTLHGMAFDVECELQCVGARVKTGKYTLLVLASCGEAEFAVLREIRTHSEFPVLLITPQGAWTSRLRGFKSGADDCISRPFEPEELIVRIEAILRRASTSKPSPSPLRIGDLLLCPDSKRAYLGETELKLTPIECDILEVLMRECGRAVTRDQLALQLYQREASPFDRAVDTHISRIRRKLGRSGRLIISIRGSGYQLCNPAEPSVTLLHEKEVSN